MQFEPHFVKSHCHTNRFLVCFTRFCTPSIDQNRVIDKQTSAIVRLQREGINSGFLYPYKPLKLSAKVALLKFSMSYGVKLSIFSVKQGSNIEVRLNADKSVRAVAIVYELAPQSDVVTRTHLTKATLSNPPAQMLLGASIVGHLRLPASAVIQVPSSSLTVTKGVAAVWIVDPAGTTVQLRPIQVGRYTTDGVIVTGGLTSGDRIVTAGVQMLHQNQKVRILEERNGRS